MAITLQQFREKYPMYNNLEDQDLADRLHAKFYSAMPKEEYYQKIQFQPLQSSQSLQPEQDSTIKQQLLQGIKDIPQNTLGALQGASDALINLPAQAINLGLPKENRLPLFQSGEGTPYDIGHLGGEVGSYALGGGALNAIRKGMEVLPGIGRAAKYLGRENFVPSLARRGIGAGIFGASQNPDDKLANAAFSGGVSLALDSLLHGGSKLLSENLFKPSFSPQKIIENAAAAEGTSTSLANIIGNPTLKRQLENTMIKVPFAGVEDKMIETAHQVKDRGNEILADILNNKNPNGLKKAIQEGLKKSYKSTLSEKTKLWDQTNEIADQLGLEVGRENLAREAKNILGEIKKSKELERKIPSNIKEDLKEYSDESNINTLRLSNIFKGSLGTEASKLFKESGKSFEYGIYKKLQEAMKRDIEGSIESSSSPALREKYDSAMRFHKEEVVPFEEKEIAKFTRRGGDPDLILSSFIKTGQNDRSELLNKLLNKLPEDKKNLVSYGYLSKAIEHGELNPLKLKNIYNSIGEEQKYVLFGKELKRKLDRYTNLVSMNTKPLSLMANPETGQKLLDLILPIFLSHGAGAIAGYGITGDSKGALAGAISTPILTKILSKKLMSPEFRKKMVESIVTGKKEDRSTQSTIMRGIIQGLLNQSR